MENNIQQKTLSDDTAVIIPGRQLDNTNAHDMVDRILELQREGYKNILMDMTDLEFLSSAGVGSILGTVENSRDLGGDIVLCNVRENVMHVLTVLDLHDYLTFQKSVETAAAKCAGGV